ncbi:MAG: hypothetical protein IPK82_29080 [Polyangiaceae bacterium]|nr:hypothetical protein [Polyangiaceae bacterium]
MASSKHAPAKQGKAATNAKTPGKKAPPEGEVTTALAPPRKLSPALAARVDQLITRKREELVARGQDEIAFIRRKQSEIVAGFYDIGMSLVRLSEPGIVEALGFAGFADLVEKELTMSPARARDLMAIAKHIRREDALRWGQEKSAALVELAQVTSEADSPAMLLKKRTIEIGPGKVLDLEHANARAIQEAAKEARQARRGGTKPKRGVTATPAERRIAAQLEKTLHKLGQKQAKVVAVARAGAGADLRIERVAAASLDVLAKALTAVIKSE